MVIVQISTAPQRHEQEEQGVIMSCNGDVGVKRESCDDGCTESEASDSVILTSDNDSSSLCCDLSDDEEEEETLTERVSYLAEKSILLNRVVLHLDRLDKYEASVAKAEADPSSLVEAPVWEEAKEVLCELSKKSTPFKKQVKFGKRSSSNNNKKPIVGARPSKKPRISLTSVEVVSSVDFDEEGSTEKADQYNAVDLMEYDDEHNADASIPTINDWQIMVDSMATTTPSKPAIKQDPKVRTLQDALVVTKSPLMVVQGIHPFLIVHANSAFLSAHGMDSSVVGKPLNTFVRTSDVSEDTVICLSNQMKLSVQPIEPQDDVVPFVLLQAQDVDGDDDDDEIKPMACNGIHQLVGTVG